MKTIRCSQARTRPCFARSAAFREGLIRFAGVCLAVNLAAAQPAKLEVLHSFQRGSLEGDHPGAALTLGPDGNFYGTTFQGGIANTGTVFRITPSGGFSSIYSFRGLADDNTPNGLTLGNDGNLYGTTVGDPLPVTSLHRITSGTVFRITTNGDLTTLHTFHFTDGMNPWAGLTLGSNGCFYGTTTFGGDFDLGTIFRITTNGVFTTLVSFSRDNGASPTTRLVQGPDGNLYGTTQAGGTWNMGTVFQVTPDGILTTMYSFTNGEDSSTPATDLTLGRDGSFYGGTWGGAKATLFQITTNGDLTTLFVLTDYTVTGGVGDTLDSSPVLGPDGNFYGTTWFVGYPGASTVFKLTPNGAFSTVYSLNRSTEGVGTSPLLTGSDGSLYGTTAAEGPGGGGTIFRLVLPVVTCSFTGIVALPTGGVLLSCSGPANQPYRLWGSSNPWVPGGLWTLLASGSFDSQGKSSYKDTEAASRSSRFYRLSLP